MIPLVYIELWSHCDCRSVHGHGDRAFANVTLISLLTRLANLHSIASLLSTLLVSKS